MNIPDFDLKTELAKCKTTSDLTGKNGLIQKLLGNMITQMLETEMDEHLGYEKHSTAGDHTGNSRNGKYTKKVRSNFGPLELEVPRDRNGEFEPLAVKKHSRNISDFDDKIISMYSKGMSVRDIQDHLKELYGCDVSPTLISNITDKVMDVATEWQSRPLKAFYPFVFFDAIHYKVKYEGKVISKAAYTCLAMDAEGKKEILGIWVGESEGARFWLKVCTELHQRGVQDILIACIDGLKGLPDVIQSVFPKVMIQLCIIHMIRNTIRFIPSKRQKEFADDLKAIYRATTMDLAHQNLWKLKDKWGTQYPLAVKPWIANWENLKTFFEFPEVIRNVIYTTNAVELVHRQMRKVTKSKSVFPSDESLIKILFLVVRDVSRKWNMPHRDWRAIISYLSIAYEDRLVMSND
jgi:transposase-like protein